MKDVEMEPLENAESNNPHNISSSVILAESFWGPRRDPLYIVLPVTTIFAITFLVGSVGNIITCYVIIRNRYMHTATNYYLFSLAISDLLLLIIGLPPEMYQMWSRYPYIFGETFCVLQGLVAETSANATVLTITAFTVERYVAICYPFFTHKLSKLSRAIRYIIFIWLASLALALPQAIQMGIIYGKDKNGNTVRELSICGLKNSFIPYSFEVSFILFFVGPMTAITILYILIGMKLRRPNLRTPRNRKAVIITNRTEDSTRQGYTIHQNNTTSPQSYHSSSTKKVVKMLVAVVAAFFICWAPFQTQRILAVYGYTGYNTSPHIVVLYQCVTYISGVLYYLSTIINPILYNIMSNKFRRAFTDTLLNCGNKSERRRNSVEISSGTRKLCCEDRHHNSVCSKNNNTCQNSMDIVTSFSKRPIVVSFSKCNSPSSCISQNGNSQTLELPECSPNCKHEATLIIHPNCKCYKNFRNEPY